MQDVASQATARRPAALIPETSSAPRWKKRLLLIAIAVIVAGAGAFGYFWYRPSLQKSSTRFETARADRGPIVAKVTATGTLSALVTVQVGSQVSGAIKEILTDFNAEVKKGQVLARIDSRLFDANLEQAKANQMAASGNLAKAKAQAVDAERQFERAKALAATSVTAQADVDTAQANAEVAKAQVEAGNGSVAQALAALHEAETNLGYATIVSPINGIVISRNVDVGQTVAASLQAPTLFQIAEDLRRMQVDTSVAESDVGKLRTGMEATFNVEAYPTELFRGTVRQVRYAPQTVQSVVTYDAVIDVENPDLKLKPGMTANVTFIHDKKDNVVRVPNSALRFRPSPELLASARAAAGAGGGAKRPKAAGSPPESKGPAGSPPAAGAAAIDGSSDQRTIWVLRDDEPQAIAIRTGLSDGTFTELIDGPLSEGDAVITEAVGGPAGGGGAKGASGGSSSMRRLF